MPSPSVKVSTTASSPGPSTLPTEVRSRLSGAEATRPVEAGSRARRNICTSSSSRSLRWSDLSSSVVLSSTLVKPLDLVTADLVSLRFLGDGAAAFADSNIVVFWRINDFPLLTLPGAGVFAISGCFLKSSSYFFWISLTQHWSLGYHTLVIQGVDIWYFSPQRRSRRIFPSKQIEHLVFLLQSNYTLCYINEG